MKDLQDTQIQMKLLLNEITGFSAPLHPCGKSLSLGAAELLRRVPGGQEIRMGLFLRYVINPAENRNFTPMKQTCFLLLLCSLFLLFFAVLTASAQKQTISGYVEDAASGERLIGASVFPVQDLTRGTASNAYGFYSLTIPGGKVR